MEYVACENDKFYDKLIYKLIHHIPYHSADWRGFHRKPFHGRISQESSQTPLEYLRNSSKLPTTSRDALTEEPSSGLRPLKRNSERKCLSCSLRLSNNNITDLCDLQKTVSHFLAEPSHLAWLDLSFNKITHIDQVLCELHGLRVLNLHGNNIFVLSEVDRLAVLPHLHSITLHGNPIETNKTYRNRAISVLPRLKTMDFSAVTQQERVMANIWHRGNTRSRGSKGSAVTAGPSSL